VIKKQFRKKRFDVARSVFRFFFTTQKERKIRAQNRKKRLRESGFSATIEVQKRQKGSDLWQKP